MTAYDEISNNAEFELPGVEFSHICIEKVHSPVPFSIQISSTFLKHSNHHKI